MTTRAKMVQVAPVLPCRDIRRSLDYYVGKLGFSHGFTDASNDKDDPRYVGVVRDGAELHLQWHGPDEWENMTNAPLIRLIVDDVDALFAEYKPLGVFHQGTALRNTAWRTREFGFYDPDGTGLIFYRDLTSAELPDAD